MNYQCSLQATGFTVTFTFTHVWKEYLDAVMLYEVDPTIQSITITSTPNYIHVNDLYRLISYLQSHLTDSQAESYIFVPLELGFQLLVHPGYRDTDGSGSVSIQTLLNIGLNGHDHARLYMGGEGSVTLGQVTSFVTALESIYGALKHAQRTMPDLAVDDDSSE